MTTKTNKLYRLINCFLIFAIAILIFSCNNSLDNKTSLVQSDSLQANDLMNVGNTLKDINLADTIRNLMSISLTKDSFEYEAFYNKDSPYLLLYFKAGNLFSSKTKHAIALYSMNDTTVICELKYLINDKWEDDGKNIVMHIDEFSPAFFRVRFDDYNFDGNKDLYINFYESMSVSYSYGYILTFNPHNNSITLHSETIEIPNLEIDKKARQLVSTVYSNPHVNKEVFEIVSRFAWRNGKLQLISKKEHKLKQYYNRKTIFKMKHIQLIETILYVNDQQASADFYTKLFRQNPDLNVPGMTEFNLAENCKLGLMPNKGIAKILAEKTPHPDEGNGIPRCELYFYVDNIEQEFDNATKIGAKLISPIEDRDWGDKVCYFADPDRHIIAFAEKLNTK